jgi:hypothetical protein
LVAGNPLMLYRVFVEGAAPEPVPMAEERLRYVLGLIFGTDAPGRLKEVIDGEAGQLVGWAWLTPRQEAAVRGLQFGSTSLCPPSQGGPGRSEGHGQRPTVMI